MPIITLEPIHAQAGFINVVGDYFVGAGQLDAPSGVLVDINNDGPAHLRIGSITIPESEAGQILFNQAIVSSNAEIAAINSGGAGAANFSSIITGGESEPP